MNISPIIIINISVGYMNISPIIIIIGWVNNLQMLVGTRLVNTYHKN